MAVDVFSSKEMAVKMVQHAEALLIVTGYMESEHLFIGEMLADVAKIKIHFGNRCFLTKRMLDELFSRDLLDEEQIKLEKEEDDNGSEV